MRNRWVGTRKRNKNEAGNKSLKKTGEPKRQNLVENI